MSVLGTLVLLLVVFPAASGGQGRAAETGAGWEPEWQRTIRAAEQEGEVVIYALNEIGEVFANGGFQKRFPKIKVTLVSARGGELVSRIMAERRAEKFLADLGDLGNSSPYRLYQSKVLDPITSLFILPEVKDVSKWWQGKHHFIDPENKYIFVFVGAPLYLVGYNSKLVDPRQFRSYWDLVDPKWKGQLVAFDPKSGGFGATRDRFFYHHPQLGPEFVKRLYGEMNLTYYARYPQGEDWLATGKFSLCLCRHQSISEAKNQGLPVDLVEPSQFKEGVGVESRAKTLIAMSQRPHPNAAKVFLNWFLSREGQTDFQRTAAKHIDAGAENSLRTDVPEEDVSPRNRLKPGVQYLPQWSAELFNMKKINQVITEARGQAPAK